jgi:hypothetical protein
MLATRLLEVAESSPAEDLNRRWYAATTGHVITDVQRQILLHAEDGDAPV